MYWYEDEIRQLESKQIPIKGNKKRLVFYGSSSIRLWENIDTDFSEFETFNALVESAALDIHAYIIQCNDRQYGDSRIRAPYKESWRRDLVRIKGGKNDYFVIGEIDVLALRQFQSNFRSPDGPLKPMPDGFVIAYERKVLPTGTQS